MKPFKTQARIHSLDGQMDEITVLKELGNNSYLPMQILISITLKPAITSAWICPYRKTVSRTISNIGTICA